MNILFITAGNDYSTAFTNQEDYINSLALSLGKRNVGINIVSPCLKFHDKFDRKPICEFNQILEDFDVKCKVYLKECDGFKKYLIDISTRPDKRSNPEKLI